PAVREARLERDRIVPLEHRHLVPGLPQLPRCSHTRDSGSENEDLHEAGEVITSPHMTAARYAWNAVRKAAKEARDLGAAGTSRPGAPSTVVRGRMLDERCVA